MKLSEVIELLEAVINSEDEDDIMDIDTNDGSPDSSDPMNLFGGSTEDDELIEQLTQIYLPVLITQEIEEGLSSEVLEACSEENVLMERNIIKFDKETRLAQLVSICARLIARQKNTPEYQAFIQASKVRKEMKLKIQQKENARATVLAHKFLKKVSASGTSSVARDAANNLL